MNRNVYIWNKYNALLLDSDVVYPLLFKFFFFSVFNAVEKWLTVTGASTGFWLTYDFVLSMGQMVAHHAAYVCSETVADTVYVVCRSPGICEMGVELGCALGHQPSVAQRRQITRKERKLFPVHREHVEVFSFQVRYAKLKH
jgi:hypothetical protein